MSEQSPRRSLRHLILSVLTRKAPERLKHQGQLPVRPAPADRNTWRAYWEAQGQLWRTEPEIEKQRQEELEQLRTIVPDIQNGIYPFRGKKLSRADLEWLLATHDQGLGPVNEKDVYERGRKGLDLRGADLRGECLSGLPLACLRGGLDIDVWEVSSQEVRDKAAVCLERADLSDTHLERANLCSADLRAVTLANTQLEAALLVGANMENADILATNLQGALLNNANLKRARLLGASLKNVILWDADLREADFTVAHLQDADLSHAHLESANLSLTHLERAKLCNVHLEGALLYQTKLDDADLTGIILADLRKHVGPQFIEVSWNNTDISSVNWRQIRELGNDHVAYQTKDSKGDKKSRERQLHEFRQAIRANTHLAVVLKNQGLITDAARFAYRVQVLERDAQWHQFLEQLTLRDRVQSLSSWIFSWFLFLLTGYGYKPERSFLAYLFVIVGFATSYYLLGLHDIVGPHHVFGPHHLTYYEAIVVSMTAFHGRGFFANQFQPGDPQAFVAAIEAFVGLLIEVTFIATLTRRLFGQ